MKYQMVDYLDKVISQDIKGDIPILKKEGVLSSSGQVVLNKINIWEYSVFYFTSSKP